MQSIARSLTNVILAGKREGSYSTTSFSLNVVVAETSCQILDRFIILRSREGVTSFNKDNSANFSGESKVQRSFLKCILF